MWIFYCFLINRKAFNFYLTWIYTSHCFTRSLGCDFENQANSHFLLFLVTKLTAIEPVVARNNGAHGPIRPSCARLVRVSCELWHCSDIVSVPMFVHACRWRCSLCTAWGASTTCCVTARHFKFEKKKHLCSNWSGSPYLKVHVLSYLGCCAVNNFFFFSLHINNFGSRKYGEKIIWIQSRAWI